MTIEQKRSIAITIRLTPAEVEELEQTAAALHQTKTAAIAAAIHLYAQQIHQTAERRPEAAASTERRAAVTIQPPAAEIAAEDIPPTISAAPKIGTRQPAHTVTAEDIAAALLKLSDNRAAYLRPHKIRRRRRISARRRSDKLGTISAAAAPADD